MNNDSPMLASEAAQYLRMSKYRLYELVRRNQIPYHKPAGKLYFYPSELDEWIRSKTDKNK